MHKLSRLEATSQANFAKSVVIIFGFSKRNPSKLFGEHSLSQAFQAMKLS